MVLEIMDGEERLIDTYLDTLIPRTTHCLIFPKISVHSSDVKHLMDIPAHNLPHRMFLRLD
jgi:hypothetical protein